MCYFSNVQNYPTETVDTICHAIHDPKFGSVDLIVGTGISGILVLLPVSMQSGIPYAAIRKPIDAEESHHDGGSHSTRCVESINNTNIHRYVIIDDLIDTGNTIGRIMEAMTSWNVHCRCVGIILYQSYPTHEYMSFDDFYNTPVTFLGKDIIELNEIHNGYKHGKNAN
jgi:adenine/guanine phosphoribosyltransferase-like PRPP-binding protein